MTAWMSGVKSRVTTVVLLVAACCASACVEAPNKTRVVEKPFVSGGKIKMQLDGGDYEVQPAAGNLIRVTLSGDIDNVKADVNIDGTHADVTVKDTPHNHFRATIEVPKAADLIIRLTAGNLVMAPIIGNKDVESYAGNVKIEVGDPNDYSNVDASLKAGDLKADAFGGSKSGLLPQFTWSGHGKYTLRAHLGAGNLELIK